MKAYLLWLAKLLTVVFIVAVAIPLFFGTLLVSVGSQSQVSGQFAEKDKVVAVVEVNGIIKSSKEVIEQLYSHIKNKKVKGIVLRVNSPGGAVAPSQDIYSTVAKLKQKKPIVVSMGSTAASGGLYVSLAASKVFCQPGTITGSIGVIVQIPNFTKISKELGFDMVTIKSGDLKDVGNPFRIMTDDERKFMEDTIGVVQTEFVNAVAKGRKLERDKVLEFADGRMIIGSQAIEFGLADKLGGLHDAAREVFEILGEPLKEHETPKLLYGGDKFSKFKKLLESVVNWPLRISEGNMGRGIEFLYLM